MSEQSDTPETDTAEREDAGPITHAMRGWNYARKHERERDEARKLQERTEAVLNTTTEAYKYDHDALTAEVERLRAERDEARTALLAIELAAVSLADAQTIAREALAAAIRARAEKDVP